MSSRDHAVAGRGTPPSPPADSLPTELPAELDRTLRNDDRRGAYPDVMEPVARPHPAPLVVPDDPPVLSVPAAAALLRILRRAAAIRTDGVPERRAS